MAKYLYKPGGDIASTVDPRPLELGLMIDRSGSMATCAETVRQGINLILNTQKSLPGEARVTTMLFDNDPEILYRGEPIATVSHLDPTSYRPSGGTALLDAIGAMIQTMDGGIDGMPDGKRSRTLLVIATDAEEHHSVHFTYREIKELIQRRTKDGWGFLLISPDAAKVAMQLGIKLENAMPWVSSQKELAGALERLGRAIESYRLNDRNFALRLRDKS
jgi:hypothetical protein